MLAALRVSDRLKHIFCNVNSKRTYPRALYASPMMAYACGYVPDLLTQLLAGCLILSGVRLQILYETGGQRPFVRSIAFRLQFCQHARDQDYHVYHFLIDIDIATVPRICHPIKPRSSSIHDPAAVRYNQPSPCGEAPVEVSAAHTRSCATGMLASYRSWQLTEICQPVGINSA
jgi:hypothetical protein